MTGRILGAAIIACTCLAAGFVIGNVTAGNYPHLAFGRWETLPVSGLPVSATCQRIAANLWFCGLRGTSVPREISDALRLSDHQ